MALVVFDLTKKDTFDYLPKWIEELHTKGPGKVPILIVGNKSDLTKDREVPIDEIQKKFGNKYLYYDVSAKNGNNITLAFDKIRAQILSNLKIDRNSNSDDIKYNMNPRDTNELDNLDNEVKEKSSRCC